MRRWLPTAVGAALLIGGLAPAPVTAQSPGLRFLAGLGYEPGGPGPALVDGLAGLGLDDTRIGECYGTTCTPTTDHPFYYDAGLDLVVLLGARYRFDAPVSLELLVSNAQRGHAEGWDNGTRDHVVVSYSAFQLTTTVGLHLGPLRLEAGPVLNTTGWEATLNSTQTTHTRSWVTGGYAGIGAGVRIRDVELSLRVGVRRLPAAALTVPVRTELEADYGSFLVGVTVVPITD